MLKYGSVPGDIAQFKAATQAAVNKVVLKQTECPHENLQVVTAVSELVAVHEEDKPLKVLDEQLALVDVTYPDHFIQGLMRQILDSCRDDGLFSLSGILFLMNCRVTAVTHAT